MTVWFFSHEAPLPTAFHNRSFKRFLIHCHVDFLSPSYVGKGTVLNVSKAGLRVSSTQTVEAGTKLALRLFVPGLEYPINIDRAVVRWAYGPEFGLQTLRLQIDQEARLERWIRIRARGEVCPSR